MRAFLRRLLMVILALLVAGTIAAAGLIGFVYYKETHLPPIGDFDTIIVLGAPGQGGRHAFRRAGTQADGRLWRNIAKNRA